MNNTAWKGAGVNVGSWLCLEDWFFSGKQGTEVSSLGQTGQGACLPPNILGPLESPWKSEGSLTKWIENSQGTASASEALKAHRETFIIEQDFEYMQNFGIKTVRIPITWAAFADALADLDPVYANYDPETATAIVPDPYYNQDISMATVPRTWLKEQIKLADKHGMKVLLDLHAFPGGSSVGTYSGIWPLPPVFWNEHSKYNTTVALTDVGLMIVQKLIDWVKELYDNGEVTSITGICAMNEPGLNMQLPGNQPYDFLGAAADKFGDSGLADRGVKLYMNLIGLSSDQISTFMYGFPSTQQDFLVLDIHYYMAWSDGCCGASEPGTCSYQCSAAASDFDSKINGCAVGGADVTNTFVDFPRRATTEFSMGTYHNAIQACQESDVLDAMLQYQTDAFVDSDVEAFFWTWRMPYGPNFEAGWSLKAHLGLEAPFDSTTCVASSV